MSRRLVALACVSAVALGGCGATGSSAGEFEGEERAVADVVEDLQSRAEAGEAAEICSELLARPLAQRLSSGGSRCEDEIDAAISDADDRELTVLDVAVTGDQARVQVSNGGEERTLTLVRSGADWRVSELAA